MLTLAQASKYLDITRGGVWMAIKAKRLKAVKNQGPKGFRWEMTIEDLEEYKKSRFSRDHSFYEGSPLFDKEKGEISIAKASQILVCPMQKLYYACRRNKVKHTKKNCHWVININDLPEYRDYLSKKNKNKPPKQELHGLTDKYDGKRCRNNCDDKRCGNNCDFKRSRKKSNKKVFLLRRISC